VLLDLLRHWTSAGPWCVVDLGLGLVVPTGARRDTDNDADGRQTSPRDGRTDGRTDGKIIDVRSENERVASRRRRGRRSLSRTCLLFTYVYIYTHTVTVVRNIVRLGSYKRDLPDCQ